MKSRIVDLLPLSVVVCLLSFIAPASAPAQSKITPKSTTNTKGTVAPKAEISSRSESVTKSEKSSDISFISPLEKQIFDEMNLARTDPQKYATYVEEFKKSYKGNQLTLAGRSQAIVTSEGIAAVDEAIKFLRSGKPLSPMTIRKGASLAAKDQANDLAIKGITGHRGSDGSSPNARLERYGMWNGVVGENIVYDVTTAREIVIGLIIDDGTSNRGHRRNIFDPNHRITGVSISESPSNGARCVITYAGGYTDKAAAQNR